jgi:Family of unknown function (DUF5908)
VPIEIKELHIKVTVNDTQSGSQKPIQANGAGSTGTSPFDKDTIVAECVEQVFLIMDNRRER